MVRIKAFKAIRPDEKFAKDVAALPYDVVKTEEAREIVKQNRHSFLKVDRAEINFEKKISPYETIVYEKAREVLNKMIEDKVLIEEDKPCLYIYEEKFKGLSQRGVVMCAAVDDYIEGRIKKHEHTREAKARDRINHVDYCNANTGPIFLAYKQKQEITDKINKICDENKAIYEFTSDDSVSHKVWKIDNDEIINFLVDKFKNVDNFYIADGHHRANSAVEVSKLRRKENPNYTGEEEFNYFLAVAFPDNELNIMDYNRVLKLEDNFNFAEFIDKVGENFDIEQVTEGGHFKPEKKHDFGMYYKGIWYRMTAREGSFDKDDEIESLDVSILDKNILKAIIGIKDSRTDERIDFVGGIKGIKELERRANTDMDMAFALYPITMTEIMRVSDKNLVMPPKSTWFEPKLRSGLFIHKL